MLLLGAASASAQGRMRPRPHAGWYHFYGRPYARGWARSYRPMRSHRPMMWRQYGRRAWRPAYGWSGGRRGRRYAI